MVALVSVSFRAALCVGRLRAVSEHAPWRCGVGVASLVLL